MLESIIGNKLWNSIKIDTSLVEATWTNLTQKFFCGLSWVVTSLTIKTTAWVEMSLVVTVNGVLRKKSLMAEC